MSRGGDGHTDEGAIALSAASDRCAVVLAHPYPVVRAGLGLLIASDGRFRMLDDSGDPAGVLGFLQREARGRRVLVAVGLGFSGPEDSYWLIRAIREQHRAARIVALGANAGMDSISRSLFVGADGFIDHVVHPSQFLEGLHSAACGETVLVGPPSEWLGPIADRVERQAQGFNRLTPRETEVLSAAAEGITAKEIGDRLGLRERTVTTHLNHIYSKLGVKSRVAAINVASGEGLLV